MVWPLFHFANFGFDFGLAMVFESKNKPF